MKEIKLEDIIYKINFVNQLTMIFHKVNLAKQSVDLIHCGSKKILVGWKYSITKDAAYCLYYYLFRPDTSDQGRGDSFVTEGFKNWEKEREREITESRWGSQQHT